MGQEFAIAQIDRDDVALIAVSGEIDIATAPELKSALERLADDGDRDVVVDLLDVTFIDSTGLGVLIATSKRCQERGHQLKLVLSEPRILRIFEITGLTGVLPIFAALDAAVLQ